MISKEKVDEINKKIDKLSCRLLYFIKPEDNKQNEGENISKAIPSSLQNLLTKTDIYLDKIERHAENVKKYNFKTSYGKLNQNKPQVTKINTTVDNSVDTPFIPIIKSKPNAINPLPREITEAQNDKVGFIASVGSSYIFPHPYQTEIESLSIKSTESFMKALHAVQELDKRQEHKFEFIETKDQLINLCQEIVQYGFISIDTEYHSERSFQGFTCLIQVF